MDIIGVTTTVANNEGLVEQHRLVVIDLLLINHIALHLKITITCNQKTVISSRLNINRTDIMSNTSTNSLCHKQMVTITYTNLFHNTLSTKELLATEGKHRTILLFIYKNNKKHT